MRMVINDSVFKKIWHKRGLDVNKNREYKAAVFGTSTTAYAFPLTVCHNPTECEGET